MSQPLFEVRYPKRYIFLVMLYLWCAQVMIFLAGIFVPSQLGEDPMGVATAAQIILLLAGIGYLISLAIYYGSKLAVTKEGLVQSWLWGTIVTELPWERVAYNSSTKLPGIEYHTLMDKDDPSAALHIDVPTCLEFYPVLCRHLEKHGISLEHGQVLRLTQPPRPISERLKEIYPTNYN